MQGLVYLFLKLHLIQVLNGFVTNVDLRLAIGDVELDCFSCVVHLFALSASYYYLEILLPWETYI